MTTGRYSGKWQNVANPEQTPEQAEDLQLEAWAALQVYSLRKGWIARYQVTNALNSMNEQKQQRARHWLNYYRGKSAE
ncbi:hypothetical protein [Oceanimonas smirnovii]|uniref:hypothetical protein n=1 Tax=Oceanimonas smirnovii TaxID=264574 RepID=UPI00036C14D9|nr:hypothetical protein [Oceanimonas smirnovii]